MKRILVVEDDPSILRGLATSLEGAGYEVLCAVDGADGYRLAQERVPDLVVLDLTLPSLSGYEVCKKLRDEGSTVPIIMLTARGEESDRVLGLDLGADDYVTKPFSVRELMARVRATLRRTGPVELPTVAGYETLELIGEGGMGSVYRARDVWLDSDVAIKVVAGLERGDRAAYDRFLREARTMASVRHPNIVHVYAFGESEGLPFIVMEYVRGESLAARIERQGALSAADALFIVRQTIDALTTAWKAGVVHRDIKPSNILMDERDWVRVCDFGLAGPVSVDLSSASTWSGSMQGTPQYVSPEQATGRQLDFRTDVYSLGIVLYEMLTGEKPFKRRSVAELVAQQLQEPTPALDAVDSADLDRLAFLVDWMTKKDPEERPPTYEALVDRVEGMLAVEQATTPSS